LKGWTHDPKPLPLVSAGNRAGRFTGPGVAPGCLLLLLRQERGYPSARPEGVHLLGPGQENGELHRAAQVRGQRAGLWHGNSDALAAQAARNATRFLQAPGHLFDSKESRISAVEIAALF